MIGSSLAKRVNFSTEYNFDRPNPMTFLALKFAGSTKAESNRNRLVCSLQKQVARVGQWCSILQGKVCCMFDFLVPRQPLAFVCTSALPITTMRIFRSLFSIFEHSNFSRTKNKENANDSTLNVDVAPIELLRGSGSCGS